MSIHSSFILIYFQIFFIYPFLFKAIIDGSIITSLPDVSEMQFKTIDEWKYWFSSTINQLLIKLSPHQIAIFYQTDIRYKSGTKEEEWIDKGYLVLKSAYEQSKISFLIKITFSDYIDMRVLWHKIVLCKEVDQLSWSKSGYTHMICLCHSGEKGLKYELPSIPAKALDVIRRGDMLWSKGAGVQAMKVIIFFSYYLFVNR